MQPEDLSGNKTADILQGTSHVPKIYDIFACKDHGGIAGKGFLKSATGMLPGGPAYAELIKPGLTPVFVIYAYGTYPGQLTAPMRV